MTINANNGLAGGTMALGKASLAAGTTTTLSTTGTLPYSILGQVYNRSAWTNQATPTTDANTGAAFRALSANQAAIYVVAVNAAGDMRVAQGPVTSLSDVTGKLSAVHFPSLADGLCPIGYLYAQAGTTLVGTWTFGTNNNSGVTGMTYTFRDLTMIPATPIVA